MRSLCLGFCLLTASIAHAQNEVNQREDNQQERIEQGEQRGQLNARQANHLERQQGRIDDQVARERAANGGHLTGAERQQVNREQNRASRNIYRKKHQ